MLDEFACLTGFALSYAKSLLLDWSQDYEPTSQVLPHQVFYGPWFVQCHVTFPENVQVSYSKLPVKLF